MKRPRNKRKRLKTRQNTQNPSTAVKVVVSRCTIIKFLTANIEQFTKDSTTRRAVKSLGAAIYSPNRIHSKKKSS